jgi:hypothetical protein
VCDGSVEEVLVGMVDSNMIDWKELRTLSDKFGRRKPGGNDAGTAPRIAAAIGRTLDGLWLSLKLLGVHNAKPEVTAWTIVRAVSLAVGS